MSKFYNTGGILEDDVIGKLVTPESIGGNWDTPVLTGKNELSFTDETFYGSCIITLGAKRLYITIPSVNSLMCKNVILDSIKAEVREGGKYLYGTGAEPLPDFMRDSAISVSQVLTPFGLNLTIEKTTAFTNAVNNDACVVLLILSGKIVFN